MSELLERLVREVGLAPQVGTGGRVLQATCGPLKVRVDRDAGVTLSLTGLTIRFEGVADDPWNRAAGFTGVAGLPGIWLGLPPVSAMVDTWPSLLAAGASIGGAGVRWPALVDPETLLGGARALLAIADARGNTIDAGSWLDTLSKAEAGARVWFNGLVLTRPPDEAVGLRRLHRLAPELDLKAEVLRSVGRSMDAELLASSLHPADTTLNAELLAMVDTWPDSVRAAVLCQELVFRRAPKWWLDNALQMGAFVVPKRIPGREVVELLAPHVTQGGMAAGMVDTLLGDQRRHEAKTLAARLMGDQGMEVAEVDVLLQRLLRGAAQVDQPWLYKAAVPRASIEALVDATRVLARAGQAPEVWFETLLGRLEGMEPVAAVGALTRGVGETLSEPRLSRWLAVQPAEPRAEAAMIGWLHAAGSHAERLALVRALGRVGSSRSVTHLRDFDTLLGPRDLRQAARESLAAIESRSTAGGLSLSDEGGGISEA